MAGPVNAARMSRLCMFRPRILPAFMMAAAGIGQTFFPYRVRGCGGREGDERGHGARLLPRETVAGS
jgi:hypothetical protein